MDLELTADQRDLRASVREVLERECPPSAVREVVEGRRDRWWLWEATAPLGWPALTVPEEHGGLGAGPVEAALLATELGRAAAPGPLLPTLTQLVPALVVADAGEELAQVSAGELTGAVAVDGGDGTARWVEEGDRVDVLVVAVGSRLELVHRAEVAAEPITSFDPTRGLATVRLVPGRPLAEGDDAVRRVLDGATVAVAAETVGACHTAFEMTRAYAEVREQFDVPIGSFQAVKHALADCFVVLEKARATVEFAALTIAEDDPRRTLAASMAKAAAGDCQRLVAAKSIQLHGGTGYTWENDLHLFVKRAKAGDALFGTGLHHRRRVGASVLAVGS